MPGTSPGMTIKHECVSTSPESALVSWIRNPFDHLSRCGATLTRLPPDCDPGVATLSRGAGEGKKRATLSFFPLAPRRGESDCVARSSSLFDFGIVLCDQSVEVDQ